MKYEILYTGSAGNCNIIQTNNFTFMIDCGVPFSWLEQKDITRYKVDFLIITHRHSDHLRVPTYNRLHREYPNIKVITNQEVQDFLIEHDSHYYVDYIIASGLTINIGDLEINFLENLHGVDTQGTIFIENNQVLLYATDLSTTAFYEQFLEARELKVDISLLENNYDFAKLEEQLEKNSGGYDKLGAQTRHLEHEDYHSFIARFVKENAIKEELHQSSSLY